MNDHLLFSILIFLGLHSFLFVHQMKKIKDSLFFYVPAKVKLKNSDKT
ncbi:hypothetical protein KR50_25890 [Jeotgalibacillus campisalis]|uniref:Uncharacterized protein n=1 Tax=Jeotgalibacillus campisalis TaxID=220754 RepID=A0A0C2RVY0_9BACL|nr:hypothetical protein KR50_25890 [Jeotgalibacillus campisalis]